MTADELRREAGLTMAALKARIEGGFGLQPLVRLHWPITLANPRPWCPPGEWLGFPFDESMLRGGDVKRVFFGVMREVVQNSRADALLFASEMWRARTTREGKKHFEQWAREVDTGFERLVKKGWAMREEAICVTAQSADDVIVMSQPFRHRNGGIAWIEELSVIAMPQAKFTGRSKMFGRFDSSTLGEKPE